MSKISLLLFFYFVQLVSSQETNFPCDFAWGASSSAYQVEGAVNSGGRTDSIWDTFSRAAGNTFHGDTGDVSTDQYHHIDEDIEVIASLGLKFYHFSLSWSRILPTGNIAEVNQEGVDYYDNLIGTLLENGIKPVVTLFHWDLPQVFEASEGGWLNSTIVAAFEAYASLCFQIFGDSVKYWITIAEPQRFCYEGYSLGTSAPGRCSEMCSAGDSTIEPYIVGHNLLMAHAHAVEQYRVRFQGRQQGQIGITLNGEWSEPLDTDNPLDVQAAERRLQFTFGWFANPLVFGDYPDVMKTQVGNRLPVFSQSDQSSIKGSFDFIGLSHFTSRYVTSNADSSPPAGEAGVPNGFDDDMNVQVLTEKNGVPIGEQSASSWLFIVPDGLRKILLWISGFYENPAVYVVANGVSQENTNTVQDSLDDQFRISYHSEYIDAMTSARNDGCDIRGYFLYSLLDGFEWADGYSKRFGILAVDFNLAQRNRTEKASATWIRSFLSDWDDHAFEECVHRQSHPEQTIAIAVAVAVAVGCCCVAVLLYVKLVQKDSGPDQYEPQQDVVEVDMQSIPQDSHDRYRDSREEIEFNAMSDQYT